MTLTLNLTPEQENRVREEAARKGLDAETFALKRILGETPEPASKPKTPELIARIKSARGFLAGLEGVSSDDFIAEKRKELELENRS